MARLPLRLVVVGMGYMGFRRQARHGIGRASGSDPAGESEQDGLASNDDAAELPGAEDLPPRGSAAERDTWDAWLDASEPGEDRLKRLDADMARPPRRLSRWVDAAATGRRNQYR